MKFHFLYIFIFLGFCAQAQNPIHLNTYLITGRAQGTTYQIKYFAKDFAVEKTQIDSVIEELDLSLSIYRTNSLISSFNNKNTSQVKLDRHLGHVVRASLKMNKITKGYFDITVLPLVNLWGFGPNGFKKNPSIHEIDSVLNFVGLKKIKLKKDQLIKKNNQVSIDVNGIAQGYSVDILADYLERNGIQNYIVELGGEIKTKGHKPTGDFIVEIDRPKNSLENSKHYIVANNLAVTTSGTYEKRRQYDGSYISHHINPKSGYPLKNSVVSVTVIANTAIEADGLDNYFMSLTPDKAIKEAEKMKDIAIYLIYSDNNTLKELQTSNFNKYIYTNQRKPH